MRSVKRALFTRSSPSTKCEEGIWEDSKRCCRWKKGGNSAPITDEWVWESRTRFRPKSSDRTECVKPWTQKPWTYYSVPVRPPITLVHLLGKGRYWKGEKLGKVLTTLFVVTVTNVVEITIFPSGNYA